MWSGEEGKVELSSNLLVPLTLLSAYTTSNGKVICGI